MGRALICLGDRTSHGGVVITATPYTTTGGRRIARIGDMVKCPKKGHGTCPIVTGDHTYIVDGRAVARHGDKTACGASLIAKQHNTIISQQSSKASSSAASNQAEYKADNAYSEYTEEDRQSSLKYDQHFQLHDEHTGDLLVNRLYKIRSHLGVVEGRTDSQGFTQKVSGFIPEEISIEVFAEGV